MARSSIKVACGSDVTPPAEEKLDFDDDNLRGEITELEADSLYKNTDCIFTVFLTAVCRTSSKNVPKALSMFELFFFCFSNS